MKLDRLRSHIASYFLAKESRAKICLFSIILLLYVLIIPSFILERSSKKELNAYRTKLTEFTVLRRECNSLKVQIDEVEKKVSLVKITGIAQALNDIFSALGIGGKIRSVKILGNREIAGTFMEERAEVQIEKVNMNELVNMFYRVREAVTMLSVKRVIIEKSFENPELLDVTMTVALFTRK